MDSKPERTEKKAENDKKGKVTQRQRTVSTLQLNCYILMLVLTTCLLITSMHANYNIFNVCCYCFIILTIVYAYYGFQLYNRRAKALKGDKENFYWNQIDHQFMSNESSDDDDGTIFYKVHKPSWRSQGNDKFLII